MAALAFQRTFSRACVTSPRASRACLAGTGVPRPSSFIAGLISQLSSASPSVISEAAWPSSAASRSCLQSQPCAIVTGDRLSLGDRSTGDLEVRLGGHVAVGVVAAPWRLRWGGSASAPVNTGSPSVFTGWERLCAFPQAPDDGPQRRRGLQSGLGGVTVEVWPSGQCAQGAYTPWHTHPHATRARTMNIIHIDIDIRLH